jgi:hypothetical protein
MAAVAVEGRIRLENPPRSDEEAVDALWAVAQLAWHAGDRSNRLDPAPALELLSALA